MINQHWATTERMSTNQLKVVLNDAMERQTKLTPLARKLLNQDLLIRGKAVWTEGQDYQFVWDNVDVADLESEYKALTAREQAEKARLENVEFLESHNWITPEEAKERATRKPDIV